MLLYYGYIYLYVLLHNQGNIKDSWLYIYMLPGLYIDGTWIRCDKFFWKFNEPCFWEIEQQKTLSYDTNIVRQHLGSWKSNTVRNFCIMCRFKLFIFRLDINTPSSAARIQTLNLIFCCLAPFQLSNRLHFFIFF